MTENSMPALGRRTANARRLMGSAPVRARGVMLKVLDFGPLLAEVTAQVIEARRSQDLSVDGLTYGMTWKYAASERGGVLWVISNEGIGWGVGEHLSMPLYERWEDGRFGVVPAYEVHLQPEEVRAAMCGEEVDLADHVRQFGGRVEENFWTWHGLLTRAPAEMNGSKG